MSFSIVFFSRDREDEGIMSFVSFIPDNFVHLAIDNKHSRTTAVNNK